MVFFWLVCYYFCCLPPLPPVDRFKILACSAARCLSSTLRIPLHCMGQLFGDQQKGAQPNTNGAFLV